MSFHKFQADHLFTGSKMLPSDFVLICDEGRYVVDIVNEQEAGGDIQKFKGLITPGFVNCHCHLELSRMRSLIPEKTGLVDFVFSVVTQRQFPEGEILHSISEAENEMKQNGIVAVGDICNKLLSLPQKQKQQLVYYNFIEVSGWLPAVATQRFKSAHENYNFFSPFSPASIVPHAPYSVSEPLWQMIQPYYHNKVVSIHNQETAFEDELFIQKSGDFMRMYELMKLDTSFYKPSGKSSIRTYFHNLSGAAHIILVHNTFTTEQDIRWVTKQRSADSLSFCICINANLYIEQATPPVELFRINDCNIVLGTDSLASNRSLSILDEIKTINRHFKDIPIEELLAWGTLNGAKALQMHETLGSFEKGKRPGVVFLENLDLSSPASLQLTTAKLL